MSGYGKEPTDRGALTSWRWQRWDLSGPRKKLTDRGVLTSWRWQREELGQNTERNRPSKAHSLPGDSRGRDLSGHGKKPTNRGTLTNWRRQGEGLVRTWKEPDRPSRTHFLEMGLVRTGRKLTNQGTLTSWGRQRVELVRTQKETDQPRHTHQLETAEGGTCQDTEKNQPTKVHSPTGDGRGRDLSGHGKKPAEQGTLTSWGRQRKGLVRTWKETH